MRPGRLVEVTVGEEAMRASVTGVMDRCSDRLDFVETVEVQAGALA